MVEVDSPRMPPTLGPAFKSGSLRLDLDIDPQTSNILETYSPFPQFGNSDPFGLDTYLLHPADVPWECLRTLPVPGENVDSGKPKKSANRMSMLRRPSPLASNPPLSADITEEDDVEEPEEDDDDGSRAESSSSSRRPISMTPGKGLRTLMGGARRKSTGGITPELNSPETMPTTPVDEPTEAPLDAVAPPADTRAHSMYSLSGSSSESSYDDPHTPKGDAPPLDVTARLAAVLEEDQQRKQTSRTSWRDWLGGRRTSFLGLRGGESGSRLLESPRASVMDLTPEIPEASPGTTTDESPAPSIADNDVARSAVQLRRLSLIKLGSLRMPSPHPLAPILARAGHLPNEVAFAIPATRRVYPMSVNAVQGTELAPARGGLRVALGLRNVIQKIDAGERPAELLSIQPRKSRQSMQRARGVRDFIARQPFEERMAVWFDDMRCEEVSMARPGYGVWDLDFSEYISAFAETEESPPRYAPGVSRPVRKGPSPPPRSTARTQPLKSALKQTQRASMPNPERPSAKFAAGVRTSLPPSSFRNAPKPSAWDESSDEEEDSVPAEVPKIAPVQSAPAQSRPPAVRTRTAPAATSRARESRLIDQTSALAMVTASRDRRHEAGMNHVQRKAVDDQRRASTMMLGDKDKRMSRPAPTRRQSTMTLAPEPTGASKRASTTAQPTTAAQQSRTSLASTTQAQRSPPQTPHKSRPTASLPSSPRLQSSDRRRVVSHYEQPPALAHRASMMSINMYGHPVGPMAAVPTITPYHTGPMMHPSASMMFAPQMGPVIAPVPPMAPMPMQAYAPQFAHGMAPQMYMHPQLPNTGRRRERPVA